MLTRRNKLKGFKFAKKLKRLFSHHGCGSRVLWTRGISIYVNGVRFAYKSSPYLHSKTPGAREWQLKNQALEFTTKGKKEGEVQVKFLVGVGHNAGVVLCECLTGRINGKYSIVRKCFRRALKKTMSAKAKLILVGGDPSQNSKVVMATIQQINGKFFWIPTRSPDLNPLENLFHLARENLNKDACNRHITTETMEQFADRAQCTLRNFKPELIDKIIETMPKRIDLNIKNCHGRIKY